MLDFLHFLAPVLDFWRFLFSSEYRKKI